METVNQLSAFEGIAAPSASGSASNKVRCQVFINHRGVDTKHTLATSIYNALNAMRLKVFLDEKELELGDSITAEIEEAMRTSLLYIAIFSPRYAESPWCLAELSYMLKTGRTIIPVFYNVEPSDLRYLKKGPFGAAFADHERKKRYAPEKLEEWKGALSNISDRYGQVLKGKSDDEGMLLKSIVNCVMQHMKKEVQLKVAKHPVGLDEAVDAFESILDSSKKIQIVGIVGMGGSGKTTLAREIYNRKSSLIDKSSFLFEVRDAENKNELCTRQKKLMQDIGVTSHFDNVEEGKITIERHLKFLKVFFILDDVDSSEQLDALLIGIDSLDSLGEGSLIIVTSRELGVLKSWGISTIYPMKILNPKHAKELFCWHSFLQPSPPIEFEDSVEKFVDYCNGLPLSLKVFGGLLYRKSKEYWNSQFDKVKRILPDDIKGRLKISFDALDEEEQEIFLDIACFFLGEKKNLAIEVWDGSGWSGVHSWEVLENKCLVAVDEWNKIKMHDQLRDLGREIAKELSPHRIWSTEQIKDIQKQATERVILIRGIKAATYDFYKKCSSHHGTPFEECMELLRGYATKFKALTPSILFVEDNYFTEECATLFPALLWLRWSHMPGKALPSWLMLKNLRVLKLPDAMQLTELWNDTDPPLELRELNLEDAHNFLKFPGSIGCLKHLKKISLDNPFERNSLMDSLPEGFCLLESLEHLQLSAFDKLTSLPREFGLLTNLRHLDLNNCSKLRMLPDSFKQLINLQHINFCGCQELTLTSENNNILENMTKLERLHFSFCRKVKNLPRDITKQLSLRYLYAAGTGLRELPSNIGELSKLEELTIGNKLLTTLPTSMGDLSSLTRLNICYLELENLPESMGDLSSLTSLTISSCSKLITLPESIGHLSSLSCLRISSCSELKTLPESIAHLSALTYFEISSCIGLETLPESLSDLPKNLGCLPEPERSLSQSEELSIKSLPKTSVQLGKLQSLSVDNYPITELDFRSRSCSSSLCNLKSIKLKKTLVSRISISQQCCPRLETLHLGWNNQLVEIETLPTSVKALELTECKMLKVISALSGGMVNLETLRIAYCAHVPRISISQQCCPRLETLDLKCNDQLVEIETLPTSVKALELRECKMLKVISALSGGMVNLETLRIVDCGDKVQFEIIETADQPSRCNMPAINLEHSERLQTLALTAACNISAIEHCLQTIKKWPSESIICARTERGVESVMKSSAFPGLTLVDLYICAWNKFVDVKMRAEASFQRGSDGVFSYKFHFRRECLPRTGH